VTVKCALDLFSGYGRQPRKPCAAPGKEGLENIRSGFEELVTLEKSL
jgi:4-hydroxy-2-oxoglutarate aldolase